MILGQGRGDERRADPFGRRPVGRRHHRHGPRPGLGIELHVEQLADLATAFADQADHDHIGLAVANDAGQQRGLAYSRLAENADALALGQGQQTVDRAHAKEHRPHDQLSGKRRRRLGVQRVGLEQAAGQLAFGIEEVAHGTDDPAQLAIADHHAEGFAGGGDFSMGRQAFHRADRRQDRFVIVETDDFRRQAAAAAGIAQSTHFTDAHPGDTGPQQHPANTADGALDRSWTGSGQARLQARQQVVEGHARAAHERTSSAWGNRPRRKPASCASRPSSTEPTGLLRRA